MLIALFQSANGMLRKKEFLPKTSADSISELVSGAAHWRRINSLTTGDETKIKKRSVVAAGSNLISAASYLYFYFIKNYPDFESTGKTHYTKLYKNNGVAFPIATIIKHIIESAAACQTYKNAKKIAEFHGEINHLDEKYKTHLGLLIASRTALLGSTYTSYNSTTLIAQALSPFWSVYELYLSFLNDKELSKKTTPAR